METGDTGAANAIMYLHCSMLDCAIENGAFGETLTFF